MDLLSKSGPGPQALLGEKLTTYPITNVFPLPLLEVLDKSAHNEALIDTNSPVIVVPPFIRKRVETDTKAKGSREDGTHAVLTNVPSAPRQTREHTYAHMLVCT